MWIRFDGQQLKKGLHWLLKFEIEDFLGCIKFIDETLAKHKPWNNVAHQTWFNNKKETLLYEQHSHCWWLRSFHLHQHWIPKVIPWCDNIATLWHLRQLVWPNWKFENYNNHFKTEGCIWNLKIVTLFLKIGNWI